MNFTEWNAQHEKKTEELGLEMHNAIVCVCLRAWPSLCLESIAIEKLEFLLNQLINSFLSLSLFNEIERMPSGYKFMYVSASCWR